MTNDNVNENIHAELERAGQALAAAVLLADHGYINDAVSRLYYVVLYHVRALLLTKALEPRSHEGALRLLGLHFVRVGIIDKKSAQIFSKLMKFREEADYNPSMMFSEDDFRGYLHEAEEVASEIKDYILGENRGK